MGRWLERLLAEVAGTRDLPAWSVFQLTALVAAFAWFALRTRGPGARLRPCLAAGFGGAAIGSVLLGIIVRVPAWVRSGFDARALLHGGIMAYGALAGLVAVYTACARLRRIPAGEALDGLAPCLGILVIFARLGCFFGGCDFGAVTSGPWGVRFPQQSPAWRQHFEAGLILASDRASLAVHPTQLYEVSAGFLMSAAAISIARRAAPPGSAFVAAAAVYAVFRFLIEIVRGDGARGGSSPLSPSQWLSALVLAWVVLWTLGRARTAHVQQRKPVE